MRMAFVCAIVIPLAGLVAMSGDGMELVRDGKATATIVAPAEDPLAYAANVIQHNIERMSGARLPIITCASEASTPRIVLRVRDGAARLDGFRIRSGDGEVVIEAASPRGCVYGAYALLEGLGCRFYGVEPLGIIVPERASITVAEGLDSLREPSYENRFPSTGSPEDHIRWGLHFTRFAKSHEQAKPAERLNLSQWSWGHIWPALVEKRFFADGSSPERMNYDKHKDWLPADEKGKRRYNGQTLCFSNPEALEWFTDNAVNWVLASFGDADYVNMWSADTLGIALCRCEKCKGRGWNATDWYMHVHNVIWRKLKERGWKNVFGWITYHGSEEPPESVQLPENGRQMDFLYAPRPRGASQHGPYTNHHSTNVIQFT